MKLASLKSGRDGLLIVVSRDLSRAVEATAIAPTLQAALDEWDALEPELRRLSIEMNDGVVDGFPFDPAACAAPLPRAFHWACAAAYVHHVELGRRARGATLPESYWTDPLLHQGGSDHFLGPADPVETSKSEGWGVDFEAALAVILDDTPMGVSAGRARDHIKLLTLVNDVSLRGLATEELAKGVGYYQSKPATAFAPCAVTPDELGVSWDGGKAHLPLVSRINGLVFGQPNAGVDMTFDFPTLIAHAAKTRPLCAGAMIGSGAVSNRGPEGGPGRPASEGGAGFSCIWEQRAAESALNGKPATPFLSYGDRIKVDMLDAKGRSIFGAIDHAITPYEPVA